MGVYNSEYENYYNSLKKRKSTEKNTNWFTRRLIVDLSGVLALIIFIMGCKIISTPKTLSIINYSKKIVNENFDYKGFAEKIKEKAVVSENSNDTDYLYNMKDKISGWFSKIGDKN